MKHGNNNNNNTQGTNICWIQFAYWLSVLHMYHLHSSQFQSRLHTITNLYTFLSVSSSFLLVAAWLTSEFSRCLLPPWECWRVLTSCQRCIFATWNNPGHMASITQFFGTPGQSTSEPINPGLSRENQNKWDFSHQILSNPDVQKSCLLIIVLWF